MNHECPIKKNNHKINYNNRNKWQESQKTKVKVKFLTGPSCYIMAAIQKTFDLWCGSHWITMTYTLGKMVSM